MGKKIYLKNYAICAIVLSLTAANVPPVLARTERGGIPVPTGDEFILSADDNHSPDWVTATSSDADSGSSAGRAAGVDPECATGTNGRRALRTSATGDLWTGWQGDTAFPGRGTRSEPYQISNLPQLMGLSELTAAGIDFEGQYIELTQDIDLGNLNIRGGNWNPIGWYQNAAELKERIIHPFKGHFDGGGNTITGMTIVNLDLPVRTIGFFGAVSGGSIKNLTIQAEQICGQDQVGILAGLVSQDTVIYNVTVSGYVCSGNDAGGIAGSIAGNRGRVVVENCMADGVIIDSANTSGCAGGIAGRAEQAYLIDNTVHTYDGGSSRIQGKGYVGGIAGSMNQTDIFNSSVTGTIGGNGSRAVGGIVGKYESGNLILARFDGDISRTNNGISAREGTFVGTREGRHNFTYGTGSKDNIAYLFTTSGAKAKNVFGSNIDGDNIFTKEAHIGYWIDNEKKYTLVAGKTEKGSGERYFYEELEAGIKYITIQKLKKEFTAGGYFAGLNFRLDHFAPGYQGEPVRGYLVSVPRIDALNANGTYDTDVAALTALPSGNNSFYRQIDKDNPAAVACGVTVTITTAPKNSRNNRYQMIYDESEPGKVRPPFFSGEMGEPLPAAYQSGGTYTFVMPECDTEIKAEYRKVTTELAMTPAETTISVVHTRSGDRKDPSLVTEVKNDQGVLIARYIDRRQDNSIEVQPVLIHAEPNQTGAAAEKTVKWAVDDTDLVTNLSDTGYTLNDARFMPNLNSAFIQTIVNREVQAQADGGYKNPIDNTVYTKHAVMTAASNPAASVDNQTVYGNTKVTVTFQIADNTTLRVEGLALNKSNLTYTVTRRLTGNRKHPAETITVTEPVILTATLNPCQPFLKNVSWCDRENGKLITLTSSGDNNQDCTVKLRYDPDGKQNPAWIQNVINGDNAARKRDPYQKISGAAGCREVVTVVSEDQTHGHVTAECEVAINFVTIDETIIHPEDLRLDHETITFNITLEKKGKRADPVLEWTGNNSINLQTTVSPVLTDSAGYKPYNKTVSWSAANDNVTVSEGIITPNLNSQRNKEIISKYPYEGSAETWITAKTVDGDKTAVCKAIINVKVIDKTYSSGGSGGGGGGGSRGTAVSGTAFSGGGPGGSAVTGEWLQTADGRWMFKSAGRTYANEWAYIHNPFAAEDQSKADWFRFSETGYMMTGWYTDADGCVYYLNQLSDNTQGKMMTGWSWIDADGDGIAKCFYFSAAGKLFMNGVTTDGFTVNSDGEWINDGVIQVRKLKDYV